MKQIFTLTVLCILCTQTCYAQFFEGFEGPEESLKANCWKVQQLLSTTSVTPISGKQSLVSEPSLNNLKIQGKLTTPYLNVTLNPITVSFQWRLLNSLSGNAWRAITINLIHLDGTQQELDKILITKNNPANAHLINQLYSKQFTLPATGVYKLFINFSGSAGDGNQHLIFDDFSALGANFVYGPENRCNSAPIANNDTFWGEEGQPVSGNLLLNDIEPNGEKMTPALIGGSKDGAITLNSDGTFTFVPNNDFTGTTTTFKYQLTDNGYTPLTSVPATVTINFDQPIIIPLKLIFFQGSIRQNTVLLEWEVAENETGSHFELERSDNGKAFFKTGHIFTSEKHGREFYFFKDASPNLHKHFYRLKCINKDGSFSYSDILPIEAINAIDNKILLLQNPVQNSLVFQYAANKASKAFVSIYSLNGVNITTVPIYLQKGSNTIRLEINKNHKKGFYLMEIKNGNETARAKYLLQ